MLLVVSLMHADGAGLLLVASLIVVISSVSEVCAYVMKKSCCLLSTCRLCYLALGMRLNRVVCG